MNRQATKDLAEPGRRPAARAAHSESPGPRVAELHSLMCNILKLHRDLLDVVNAKLAAMRRSDAETIQCCVRDEGLCIREIQRQEGVRQCVAQHLAHTVGLSHEVARKIPLQMLLERIGGDCGTQLADVGQELRTVLVSLRELNERSRTMATVMQDWHRSILEDTRAAFAGGPLYGRRGRADAAPQAQVIDAHY